jgi:hypothetical protein
MSGIPRSSQRERLGFGGPVALSSRAVPTQTSVPLCYDRIVLCILKRTKFH